MEMLELYVPFAKQFFAIQLVNRIISIAVILEFLLGTETIGNWISSGEEFEMENQ